MIAQISGSPYLVGLTCTAQLPLLWTTCGARHDNSGCRARACKSHVRCKAVKIWLWPVDQFTVLDQLVAETAVAIRKRRRPNSPRQGVCEHDKAVVQFARSRMNSDRIQFKDGTLLVDSGLRPLPSSSRAEQVKTEDR